MRRGLAIVSILVLTLALGLVAGRESLRRALAATIQRTLAEALPMPVRFETVSLDLFPPRLAIRRPVLIRGAATIARAESVVITIALGSSVWEGNWFVDASVEAPSITIDPRDPWWEAWSGAEPGSGSGSFRRLTIRDGEISLILEDAGAAVVFSGLEAEARVRGLVTRRIHFRANASGRIRRADHELAIDRVAVAGRFGDGGIRCERAELRLEGTVVRASGSIRERAITATLEGAIGLDRIVALIPEAGDVSGGGRVSATLSGTMEEPTVDAELATERLRIGRVEISGSAPLRLRGRDWELGPGKLRLFGGEAAAAARGLLTPHLSYTLEGEVRGWDPARFLAALDLDVPIKGTLSGKTSLHGRLLADEVEGHAAFDLIASDEHARGDASFRVSPRHDVIDLAIRPREGGEILARDEISADGHDGRIVVRDLDLATIAPFFGLELAGMAEGTGIIGDERKKPHVIGTTVVRGLEIGGTAIGEVSGPFDLSAEGLASAAAMAPDLGAQASGKLAFDPTSIGDVRVEWAEADAERWTALARRFWPSVPRGTGRISGWATVGGARASPLVNGDVTIGDATVEQESLGKVHAALDRSKDATRLTLRAGGTDGDDARLELRLGAKGEVEGELSITRWNLAHLVTMRRLSSRVEGIASLEMKLRGSQSDPIATGSLRVADAVVAGMSLGDVEGDLQIDEHAALAKVRTAADVTGAIEAAMPFPHRYRANASWTGLVLSPSLGREGRLTITTAGRAELAGDAARPFEHGVVRLDRFTIDYPGGSVSSPAPWVIGIAEGTAILERGELTGDMQRIVVSGRASTTAYALTANGEASLALAEGWVPGLVSSRGKVGFDIAVSGSPGTPPRVRGHARVEEGAADLGMLVGVTGVSGALDFRDDQVTLRDVGGMVGGGRFSLAGVVSHARGYSLRWQVRRASLGFPEWLDHRVTGEGTAEGPFAEPTVAGDVTVEQAIYAENIEWGEFLPWFRRQTRAPSTSRRLPLRFDLNVVADDGIFVDNNLAHVELAANLHLGGNTERATLGGRIEVLEGKISFRERIFDLTAGELRFDESRPFDPALEIRGESRIQTPDDEVEIDLHVSGTAESPRIEFTSDDPSLGQNDLVSLVTLGRTVSQLQTRGGAAVSLDEVLSLTAGSRAEGLESDVRRVLPVDRIEIESAFSRASGTTEPRLRIGKDLTSPLRATPLGDALRGPMRATLGSTLGTGREQDATLEYGLTRSISIEGLWESQTQSDAGAFGANVKFRLPFWGPRFSLLPEWLRRPSPP